MSYRLLTDAEVKDVAHTLWLVSQDQEKRLKALHEDGHPDMEASERALSLSMRILAVVQVDTGRLVLRNIEKEVKSTCDCHRDLNHDEGVVLNQAMDGFSDRIRHLFPHSITFSYLEQLGRELCRVGPDGAVYFGTPAEGDVSIVHLTKEHVHN